MNTLIPKVLCVAAAWMCSTVAAEVPVAPPAQDDCPGVAFALDAKRWAAPWVVVAPEYPAAELAAGVTATVDVEAHVPLTARISTIHRVSSEPANPAFEQAVLNVVKYWFFYRQTGCDCTPVPADVKLRVWFEIKEGKPSVNISSPSRERRTPSGVPVLKNRSGMVALMTEGYPRAARRAGEQADVFAAVHLVPGSGAVRDVEIKWIDGAPSTKRAFERAVQTGLAQAEFSMEGMLADSVPLACMAISYRLTG